MEFITSLKDRHYQTATFLLCNLIVTLIYFFIGIQSSFLIAALFFIVLILAIITGYNLIKRPALGIAFLIFSSSLDAVGKLATEATYSISLFHVFVLLTIVVVVINKLKNLDLNIKGTNFNLQITLFIFWIGVSLLYSPNRLDGFIAYFRIVALIIVMYLTINAVNSKDGIIIVLILLLISGYILSLLGIYDFIKNPLASQTNVFAQMNKFTRSSSIFINPNNFGMFLLLPIIMSSSLILNVKLKKIYKILLILGIGLSAIALILTYSRAAWIALFPAIFILYIFSENKKYIYYSIIVVIVIFVIALITLPIMQSFLIRILSLFESTLEESAMTRIFLIVGGIKMFLNSYLLGVGFRGFMVEYFKYMPPSQVLKDVFVSHTLPIEILAELGIVGITLFFSIVIKYFRFGFRSIKFIKDSVLRACQIGCIASVLAILVFYLFSPSGLENNFLWIFMGLTFSIVNISTSNSSFQN